MKKKKIMALLLAASLTTGLLAATACGDPNNEEGDSTPLAANNKIYLVGDSTVCSFADNYYIPRYGYGTQLHNYINCEESQIKNLALSGRSSKSFLTEANYITLRNSISQGDYLIIGFGHNDEKSDDSVRYTNPNKTHTDSSTENGISFQYNLYEKYVKLATDNGAIPILCTPIVRYDQSGSYTGSKIHNTGSGALEGDYAKAIRDLGAATNTTVVDLTTLTKNLYMADNAAAADYHAYTSYTGEKPNEARTGRDDTHINKYGAKMVAYQFANAIKSTGNSLKNNIKTNISAPTKEADYADAIKTDFVKANNKPFDPSMASDKWTISEENWYGTVMGDVGGTKNFPNYTVKEEGGVFTVGNHGDTSGKFAGASDGFGAAFIQIDAKKNFTASATVKIKSLSADANNQSGFGMMLRDDIYIDVSTNTINSNYVAAGAFKVGGAIFSRTKTDAITKEGNATTVATDAIYNVSITRLGQRVTVTFNDGTNDYSKEYTDFDFVAVDNNYMYLCLFANRGIVCEFSNVQFEITGDAIGA